jgi:GTP-binding protein Era
MENTNKRSGVVVLVGRPNVGKSTLLNALMGTKVSITSPSPQTTRFNIQAVLNEERGQIIFTDTPGIFDHVQDNTMAKVNQQAVNAVREEVDLLIYVVDVSRARGTEENRVLGILRKIDKPKIMVLNKIDIKNRDFRADYEFIKDEIPNFVEVSALEHTHLKTLLSKIFEALPLRESVLPEELTTTPILNMDSKKFMEELIREKVFLNTREEVPYSTTAEVEEITERENGVLYVKAKILTSQDRYKGMIIGREGKNIKEIGQAVRKELEVSGNRKVFVDLTVEVDEHWMERLI